MLVSRYEYQTSTIRTEPDPASGLSEVDASRMHTHNFGQNASWTPLNWLCLQAGFNYVVSETKTPASDYTQSILNAQNNYWTVNFNSSFVLDEKTDLNLGYFYYRADDYQPRNGCRRISGSTADLLLMRRVRVAVTLCSSAPALNGTPLTGRS